MKKIILGMAIIMILLISGCDSGNTTSTSSSDPFIGGTDSITMSFEPEAPPAEIYGGGSYPFEISLTVKNIGEYHIPENEMEVKILGLDPNLYSTTAEQLILRNKEEIRGKYLSPEGEIINDNQEVLFDFNNLKYYKDVESTMSGITIKATSCFNYQNIAQTQICIKSNLLDNSDDDICSVKDQATIYNSNGPVHITDFSQTASGEHNLIFTFKVKHVGDGSLYLENTNCVSERINEDKVWINIETETDIPDLSCTGLTLDEGSNVNGIVTGIVNLGADGERTIRCSFNTEDKANSPSYIKVYSKYGYKKDVTTSLTIRPNK
jgi:hypothetical protein